MRQKEGTKEGREEEASFERRRRRRRGRGGGRGREMIALKTVGARESTNMERSLEANKKATGSLALSLSSPVLWKTN